ncbi:molybdenum cofactor biosynthesis protein B [Demequina sp. NBRC 110055]|uniref:MogA/MoaB family molybdenum cofactor biosynthesis protein n=1 Tax=Demequina sp. NBRC 110055 TaxID=1570344 RepID=UPI00190ED4DC|nr:MogA/MoaB family molybdenum cofactor biosynthesis protein [Demequina sp. NBRC 110055]
MPHDLAGVTVAVITVSDRRSAGAAPDTAGPAIADALREAGATTLTAIVPDGVESVRDAVLDARSDGARVIITTGGTGVSPRDLTPEATAPLIERPLPGIPELLRREGAQATPMAAVSRGLAGVTAGPDRALVVNLPGSEGAARDGIATLLPILAHVVGQLDGSDH